MLNYSGNISARMPNARQLKRIKQFAPFCPVYFDHDYDAAPAARPTDLLLPPQIVDARDQYVKIQNDIVTAANIDALVPGAIDRMLRLYRRADKLAQVGMAKPEQLRELLKMINIITKRPELIFECDLRGKTRMQKVEAVWHLCRHFPSIDDSQVAVTCFGSLRDLITIKSFRFDRTMETLSSVILGNKL